MKKSSVEGDKKKENHQNATRSERLAEELRENLKRRKEKERASYKDNPHLSTPLSEKQKEN